MKKIGLGDSVWRKSNEDLAPVGNLYFNDAYYAVKDSTGASFSSSGTCSFA